MAHFVSPLLVEVHPRHHGNGRGSVICCPSSRLHSSVTANSATDNDSSDHRQRQQPPPPPPPQPLPSWRDYFHALVEFQHHNGHTRVPKRHTATISISIATSASDGPQATTINTTIQLGAWVSRQRQRKDRLNPSQISHLDSIHFCWNAQDDKERKVNDQWWKRFHGHSRSAQTSFGNDNSIASSVGRILVGLATDLVATTAQRLRRSLPTQLYIKLQT